jgi:hypothetical protein
MEDMDAARGVVLINSTPSYYFILPFCVGMLRRYAPDLLWDIVLATEEPDHPICADLQSNYGVRLLHIPKSRAGFIESRLAGLEGLRSYDFCLMLQDDFILEMPARVCEFERLIAYMMANPEVASARLMPCPGPSSRDEDVEGLRGWKRLSPERDTYGFSYQATLWRTAAAEEWFAALVRVLEALIPKGADAKQRRNIEIRDNLAENSQGQKLFWNILGDRTHIAWVRRGTWSNAVYLSPFPYRPTAIVRGAVEEWARDLAKREGFSL